MNVLMLTNTYKPILGGLEKSVESFSNELRKQGHRVIIVAPEYEGMEPEEDVVRIPAIQHFNGSDFSVQLPIPGVMDELLKDFRPDVVHTHHPFLIGDTALRLAAKYNVPLVFTHHTLYEENVHYVPGNQEALKKFVIELSTGFANMADHVIAPSESIRDLIRSRGVNSPVHVIPTGIYVDTFRRGAGKTFRKKHKIPSGAFVVGHLGRLAPEKNLEFVAEAVSRFLKQDPGAYFLVAGKGPSEEIIQTVCAREGVRDRLRMVGALKGKDLIDAYHAMDVFAFASQSETQGLVLTETMAAGTPVVAVDAPGVREVVDDGVNGRLLAAQNQEEFIAALQWVRSRTPEQAKSLSKACRMTAEGFSMAKSLEKLVQMYTSCVIFEGFVRRPTDDNMLTSIGRLIQTQLALMANLTKAAAVMIVKEEAPVLEPDLAGAQS